MRDFDVVLYGATGFTGRHVKYFSQQAPPHVRWAIAGRDRTKLERLGAGVPAMAADSKDQRSIDAFVRRGHIVLSTAGPFELYSDGVVDACVRFGTHYVDISGETLWCVCEAALTLAYEDQKLPDRAGVLTPSTGLGQPLWNRLNASGIRFAVAET